MNRSLHRYLIFVNDQGKKRRFSAEEKVYKIEKNRISDSEREKRKRQKRYPEKDQKELPRSRGLLLYRQRDCVQHQPQVWDNSRESVHSWPWKPKPHQFVQIDERQIREIRKGQSRQFSVNLCGSLWEHQRNQSVGLYIIWFDLKTTNSFWIFIEILKNRN